MSTSVIRKIKERHEAAIKAAVEAKDPVALKEAFAKYKEFHPVGAVKLEAELKAQEAAKVAAELKVQEEVLAKAKAEMQELTVAELVKQNAVLNEKLEELSQLFHRFSDAAIKNDAKHEHIIAELHSQIHELKSQCSGSDSGFHNDME